MVPGTRSLARRRQRELQVGTNDFTDVHSREVQKITDVPNVAARILLSGPLPGSGEAAAGRIPECRDGCRIECQEHQRESERPR